MSGKTGWLATAVVSVALALVSLSGCSSEKPQQQSRQNNPGMPPGPIIEKNAPVQPLGQLTKMPDDPKELAFLGDRYFENRRYQEALQVYNKVLALDPSDADTVNDKGLALHYLGRSNEAIDVLKKGTEIAPNVQRMWLSLGFIQMASGLNEDAKTSLAKAAEIDPKSIVGQEAQKMLGSIQ